MSLLEVFYSFCYTYCGLLLSIYSFLCICIGVIQLLACVDDARRLRLQTVVRALEASNFPINAYCSLACDYLCCIALVNSTRTITSLRKPRNNPPEPVRVPAHQFSPSTSGWRLPVIQPSRSASKSFITVFYSRFIQYIGVWGTLRGRTSRSTFSELFEFFGFFGHV